MSCGDRLRSTGLLPRSGDLELGWFLCRVRVIRTGVHFQLAIHRLAQLRLGEHPADGVFDQLLGPALPHQTRTLLAQAALVSTVLPVDLLIFLAAGELHLRGVDDDDEVAQIEKRRVGRLVLALQPARRNSRNTAEDAPVGIDHMPARAFGTLRRGDDGSRHERYTLAG